MPQPPANKYVTLGEGPEAFRIWWDPVSEAIHVASQNPAITDPYGKKAGLYFVASSKPTSANYHPSNFNRLAKLLRENGKPAPADVEVHPRELATRAKVIAKVAADDKAKTANPPSLAAVLGVPLCPTCFCLVADLGRHTTAAHSPAA